jgi:hypothetical protein
VEITYQTPEVGVSPNVGVHLPDIRGCMFLQDSGAHLSDYSAMAQKTIILCAKFLSALVPSLCKQTKHLAYMKYIKETRQQQQPGR